MPDFIKLIHGNSNGRPFLINEFQKFWFQKTIEEEKVEEPEASSVKERDNLTQTTPNSMKVKLAENSPNVKISKRQLEITFNKIASWIRCPDPALNRICWWVHEETRNEHQCTDLPIPNQWNYLTRKEPESSPSSAKQKTSPVDDKTSTTINASNLTPSIRKFARVIVPKLTLTPDDAKKKFIKINLNQVQSTLPNETKATLTDTNKLLVPKMPRRIVPTAIKNIVQTIPDKDDKDIEVLEVLNQGEAKEGNASDFNIKKAEASTPSVLNFLKPSGKTPEMIKLDSPKNKQEDVKPKLVTDSTPSILNYVKRIASAKVQNPKRPKLAEESPNKVINID